MRWRGYMLGMIIGLGLCWLVGLWLNHRARTSTDSLDIVETLPPLVATSDPTPTALRSGPFPRPDPAIPRTTSPGAPEMPAAWDAQRDDILRSSAAPEAKAQRLLTLLPGLSPEDMEEAAQHLANLLPDERFSTAADYLTNPAAPASVRTVLLAELSNRPERIKLPLLLAVARDPENPQAEAAREFLTPYLPANVETNWPAWEEAIHRRLLTMPQ